MKEFYHAHYSSNIMCLSVYGSQSLDDLEILVKEKFAAVPNSNLPPANIPSKNLQAQYIVAKDFLVATFDLFLGQPRLVKRSSIPYDLLQALSCKGKSSPGKLLLVPAASCSLPVAALSRQPSSVSA